MGTDFYIGFDPTADSLHVGSFLQMVVMSHLQKAGHRPIVLFGGGTGLIGDPSGKTDMRKMLTIDQIEHNIARFKKQMERFIDFREEKAIMVNNASWLRDLNYIEFLRDIGVYFSINRMLAAECYKARLEKGLTFFELNYMIMQSYDFYVLNRDYDCLMQLGGDDQWSNIIGGVELIRKKTGKDVYGMTLTLLTKSDGKKMGKTESGAIWLDETKTTPYEFYQYWRNIDDADVIKCLKMLTFIPLEQIKKYENLTGEDLNRVKEILAYELTTMIHGKEKADKAKDTSKNVFGENFSTDGMPGVSIEKSDFDENGKISILELLFKSGLVSSKSEGRRLLEQGGISIASGSNPLEKVLDYNMNICLSNFNEGYLVIKKGKKLYFKVDLT